MPVRSTSPSGSTTSMPQTFVGVVAVRGVAAAVLQGVADDAAPAQVGDRRPAAPAGRLEGVVQVEPAHAGLDHGVAEVLVDLEDLVHLAHVHDDRAAHARCRRRRTCCCGPGRWSTAGCRARWRCRTIAWTCSVVVGETAAEASHSSDCLYAYGSRNSRSASVSVMTASAPSASTKASIAFSTSPSGHPGRQDSGHGSPPDLVRLPVRRSYGQPLFASRRWRRSWAASSISLWRHSAAR